MPPADSMAHLRFSKGSAQAHQLFDLTAGGADPTLETLGFGLVDGHRRVRCLVGVDADDRLADCIFGQLM